MHMPICPKLLLLFIFLLAVLIVIKILLKKRPRSVKNKHVVITGGSSGIGKSLAVLFAKIGAHVTILARNKEKLQNALEEIEKARSDAQQKITSVSVDVSDYGALKKEFEVIENSVGPIFGLVNCAGIAICGKVEEFTIEEVKTMIDVNYLGTLYPIQLVAPKMKEQREGFVVLTASQVALMGMFGYSVYSSCKFALRGLAESLEMELRPYGVSVTLALPPDTDTPGFEIENKRKPVETKLLSESGGIYQPEEVAEKIARDALVKNITVYALNCWLLFFVFSVAIF